MKLISCMGLVYSCTDRAYVQILRSIRDNGGSKLNEPGVKYLGDPVNLTDVTSEQARELLIDFNLEKQK